MQPSSNPEISRSHGHGKDAGAPLGPPPPPVPSDRRLKRDIQLLARLPDGTKLYSFRYVRSKTVHVGVMAQDLLDDPARAGAVSTLANGYYAVDYHRIGLRMATLEDWNRHGTKAVTVPPKPMTAGSKAA